MRSRFALLLMLLTCCTLARAELPPALKAFSGGLETLQGRFEQEVYDAEGVLKERSHGTIALSAPRQFRWDYLGDFPQTIVADGDRVWVYDPELEQASVRLQSHEEESSPLAALIDPEVLQKQFFVSVQPATDGSDEVELSPRKGGEAGFSKARLKLRKGELLEMEFTDQLQQRSLIRFSEWQRNAALAAGLFTFEPPPGVDVIGDPGTPAEVYAVD